jgi:DNA-binding MarR family transcriptional regulator
MVVLDDRGPMKLAAVADQLAVNPSTALRMVERLAAAGMVSRATSPQVRREIIVRLTDEGRRVVDDVTARRRTEIAAIVALMAPSQRTRLVAALRAFNQAGGEPPAEPPTAELSPLGWA